MPTRPCDPILVTGATGRQGGAVARNLLRQGFAVRAVTRNPASTRAQPLRSHGAELIIADMDNRTSLERAMHGCYGVYSVQDFTVGAEREIRQGKNIADAAHAAGVEHLVYSSVGGADRDTGIDHWARKRSSSTSATSGSGLGPRRSSDRHDRVIDDWSACSSNSPCRPGGAAARDSGADGRG